MEIFNPKQPNDDLECEWERESFQSPLETCDVKLRRPFSYMSMEINRIMLLNVNKSWNG